MAQKTQRYDRVAGQYHRYRPRYPDALISHLAKIIDEALGADVVVDVGVGTGIFARQLKAALPDTITIIGIEPSPSMRAQAVAETTDDTGLEFRDGVAERLPLIAGSAGRLSRRPQRIGSTVLHFTPRRTAFCFRAAFSPSSNMFAIGRAARSLPH